MPRPNFLKTIRCLTAAAMPAAFIACESPTDVPTPTQPEVASIQVQNAPATLLVGETVQLVARVRDAAGALLERPVVWSTTDTAVATVSADGLLTARSAGPVEVRAAAGGRQTVAPLQVRNGAPVLSALLPASAVAGSELGELVISGTGFAPGAVVLWNGQARETRVVNATEIRADLHAADLATSGLAAVTVANAPQGAGTESNRLYFTIEPAPASQPVVYDLVGLDSEQVLPIEVQRFPLTDSAGVTHQTIHRVVAGRLTTTAEEYRTRWEIALTIAFYSETTGQELRRDTYYWWGTLMYDVWTGQPILQVENLVLFNLETELRNDGAEWIVQQSVHTSGAAEHTKAWKYVRR